jgi:hypothetical protein
MSTPNYSVNYNDKRFQQVENEEKIALNQSNNMYNQMINNSQNYYQEMIDASKDYQKTQTEIQNQNTQHTINKIEQQKDQAKQDYIKEQKGAYTDYQKASNQYGANAEAMASQGMSNTGYSESAQVSMYNTYQNRYMSARDSYNRAVLNYDNSIKDAQLANSSALAEIAYQALQQQLQLSLEGFQYKNTLLQQQLQAQREIDSEYYSRWQNVLSQINTENSLKEQVRQYNEKMAEEKRQYNESLAFQKSEAAREQANWEKEYALAVSKANASSGSSSIKKSSSGSSSKSSSSKKSSSSSSSSVKKSSSSSVNKSSSSSSSNKSTITLSNGTKAYSSAIKAYQAGGGGTPYSSQALISKGLVKQYAYNGQVYYYPTGKKVTLNWR